MDWEVYPRVAERQTRCRTAKMRMKCVCSIGGVTIWNFRMVAARLVARRLRMRRVETWSVYENEQKAGWDRHDVRGSSSSTG